jgi:3D (Asp-Asp-Asp) domain-containing protein
MTAWIATVSTAFCLSGTMADGSGVRFGSIAHNGYPLGTRVTVSPPFYGRRRFTVRDRIGWGTSLDFWAPNCSMAIRWGRRVVRVRRGWTYPRVTRRLIEQRRAIVRQQALINRLEEAMFRDGR